MSRRVLPALALLLLAGTAACRLDRIFGGRDPNRVDFVEADFVGSNGVVNPFMHVGDTVTLRGTAWHRRGWLLPDSALHDSEAGSAAARRFTWTSSDPTVATVGSTGLVTALRPGETELRVAFDGMRSSERRVHVFVPAASLALEAVSPSLAVGDVDAVRVVARDARGAEVTGVPVTVNSTNAKVLSPAGSHFFPTVAPEELRFRAWRAGTADLVATTLHFRPASRAASPAVTVRVVDPGTAPDTLPRRTQDPVIRIEAGRTTLRAGDTTTVRLVYRNTSTVTQRFTAPAGCELTFDVHDGAFHYASSPPRTCGAESTFAIAPGDSLVRQRTWRAVDDVLGGGAPMAPGLYFIRAIATGSPSFLAISSEGLLVRVLP